MDTCLGSKSIKKSKGLSHRWVCGWHGGKKTWWCVSKGYRRCPLVVTRCEGSEELHAGAGKIWFLSSCLYCIIDMWFTWFWHLNSTDFQRHIEDNVLLLSAKESFSNSWHFCNKKAPLSSVIILFCVANHLKIIWILFLVCFSFSEDTCFILLNFFKVKMIIYSLTSSDLNLSSI